MTDPLKNKFKAFTFKLFHPHLRHDLKHCQDVFAQFLSEPTIQIIDYWFDYEEHVGIHFNGILKSTSYKNLYAKYSAKDTKIPESFLKMIDLPSTKDYNQWLFYCYMRKEVNWKRFNGYGGTTNTHLREDEGDSKDTPRITF